MAEFPSASFYQINLDVPRLSLPDYHPNKQQEGDRFNKSAAAVKLFYNYTKRNAIANYVQSQGCIGARIINQVAEAVINVDNRDDFVENCFARKKQSYKYRIERDQPKFSIDKDELIFWLYVAVREEKLPISYYNNMIESGIVMTEVFNQLFVDLDEQSFKVLGSIPGTVFQKHFTTLFAEMSDPLALMVLDLIFVFGSGCMRGTFQ